MRFGAQKIHITPPIGSPLGGYIARSGVSRGIHDELYARVLVIDGQNSLVIVSVDLIGIENELADKIRKSISISIGIPVSNILVAATHTHSGPDLLFGYQGKASFAYREVLSESIVGAAEAAWLNRSIGLVGVGKGSVEGIGVNRRNMRAGATDTDVGVLSIETSISKNIMINYTCHPTVLGPENLLISSDYPGYTTSIIEEIAGPNAMVMFTNGADGDINAGHSADLSALGVSIPGRTFERAEKLGIVLAGEVLKVIETRELSENISVVSRTKKINLRLRKLLSIKKAQENWRNKERVLDALISHNGSPNDVARARVEKLYAELLFKKISTRNKAVKEGINREIELQGIRIGECGLLAFPGELFVESGLRIKERAKLRYTYIVGYANGYIGYVPTKDAFESGGYETVVADFEPESAEIIEEESVKLLRSLD